MPNLECGIITHAPEFSSNGSGGFKKESFSDLIKFESKNFWFKARNKLIIWALHKYKPLSKNFLEIGCGTGFVLGGISTSFPSVHLVGSEIHREGLHFAIKRVPKAEFIQMDARQTPYLEEFDSIGAFDVLEHIKSDESVLRELYTSLKPGGILLVSVPQHPFLWSAADEYACHQRRYKIGELEKKLSDSGFAIERSTSFVSFLLPLLIISRLSNRNLKNFNPQNEFKINKYLNYILYIILRMELNLLKIGINLPLGGSRFIVAKKKMYENSI